MSRNKRVLVIFVDALGPEQTRRFGERLRSLPHHQSLDGILGYSSGALPTILTGSPPATHGRMCLFSARAPGGQSILAPLRWLGLLPRVVHERGALRRRLARLLSRVHGLTGYVALHRVPPEVFPWLDLPEREDMFRADHVGDARTFLADAREAGLHVFASPWQMPEAQRWRYSLDVLRSNPPELAFLYCAELDAALHLGGNAGAQAEGAIERIASNIEAAREAMASDGATLTTLVVGDHGMADIHRTVDPRPVLSQLSGLRLFVDSTMLRLWGSDADLARARRAIEGAGWPGRWLDEEALRQRNAPVQGQPYGRAMFLLEEGVMFAPSFLGGRVAGMHGYDIADPSARASLLSDTPIPNGCAALTDIAPVVRERLGVV